MNPFLAGVLLGIAAIEAMSIAGLAWFFAFSTEDAPKLWAPHQEDGKVIDMAKYRRWL